MANVHFSWPSWLLEVIYIANVHFSWPSWLLEVIYMANVHFSWPSWLLEVIYMANRCISLGLLGSWRLYTWLTGALLLAFLALGGYIHG